MNKTKIEWCDVTLNPVVGCTYGCEYCYARKMNQRFGWIKDFSKPQFFPNKLKKLESKKPQVVFMNSLSDIADWKEEWICETDFAMEKYPQHNYLFLTKRFDDFIEKFGYTDYMTRQDCMIGLTVDTQSRIDKSIYVPDFLSIEPILEPIKLDIKLFYSGFIKWVIIGAETGNRKGKIVPKKEWVDNIVTACDLANVPVFMKDSLIQIVSEENMRREFPW